MARIRTIKPSIAKHWLLFELEQKTGFPIRFAWAVLSMVCDREGRFKWRPQELKPDVLPHDQLDFGAVLNAFLENGFIVKYRVGEEWFGAVPTFHEHQRVNAKESPSTLPSPENADEIIDRSRVDDALPGMDLRKGREGSKERSKGNGVSTAASHAAMPTTDSPAFLEFPVVGASAVWVLTEAMVREFEALFPTIDVRQDSRNALGWVLARPGRRKTSGGMKAFLTNWYTRTVNNGGGPKRLAQRPGAMPAYSGWKCPHVENCGGNRDLCRNKTVLGPEKYPVRAAS